MDSFFSSLFESVAGSDHRQRSSWSFDTLKNFHQISPRVQNHLKLVYLTLCCALFASAVGAYVHILWNIGGWLTTFGFLGCIGALVAFPEKEEKMRVRLLMAAGLLEGASVGPLIQRAIEVNPSILVTAFVGCAIAFGCFSMAAMLARRREYLYLGGLLSAGISTLLWLQFASFLFGASMSVFMFEIYFGLLIFVGYIVFDTQEIIEKAHNGDMDYVVHAMTLFTDFVGLFVRVLIIMLKNAEEKKEKERKKRR
ncbi:Bax inhibitor 1-like protein [Drosera capensis]